MDSNSVSGDDIEQLHQFRGFALENGVEVRTSGVALDVTLENSAPGVMHRDTIQSAI